ncbi:F-box protein [Legionella drozanskii]|uniref:F-box protein n=1 Tax=Legionella drozanskii TaxID=96228 RepID=UPI001040E1CE|nr:F-box protein [Legionella drozanskii]
MKEPNEVTPEFSDEIWLHILSFLDLDSLIKSLGNLELVSSKFRDLINDSLFWKDLFVSFFPKEIPPSLADDFNWKNAFIPLYIEQYGYLEPETQKLIFLIAKGNIAALRRLNIRIDDLKTDGLVLIKTAIRLNRQVILEYFYSISQQELPAQTEQDSLAKPKTDSELDLLYWVVSPREQTDIFKTSLLAAEAGHLDLLLKLLDSPENPATQNITKFHQLYSRVICSGQMYMLTGIEDFIARHKRQASSNPHSAKIVKASALLPNSRIVAASFGINSIFIRLNNQLQQKLIENEQVLISASASSKEVKLFKRKVVKEKASFAQAMEKAMLLAAEKGHIPLIKYALKKQFICINQKLCGDSSLLTKAALAYRPKLVQFLLANQADPELVLHELLRLNARIEPEGEQKRQNEEMILVPFSRI